MSFIVKNTTIPSILDLIAPHSCRGCGRIGAPLCNRCKKYILDAHYNFCPKCKNLTSNGHCPNCHNLPPTFVVAERSGLIDTLIHIYKYSSVRALAHPLAEILAASLPQIDTPVIIVPLPTINRHIRARGFDHMGKIAHQLAHIHPNFKVENLLLREGNSVQVGANKTKRQSQAQKAYKVNPKITIDKTATYLLVDDVWTTGASMESAVKKLQQAGVSRIMIGLLAVSRI